MSRNKRRPVRQVAVDDTMGGSGLFPVLRSRLAAIGAVSIILMVGIGIGPRGALKIGFPAVRTTVESGP